MEHEVKSRLNKIWSSVVEDYKIDFLRHSIIFKVKSIFEGNFNFHTVVFEEVASYYFENRFVRLDAESWDYIELTSAEYYPEGLANISLKSEIERAWLSQYSSKFNIAIEMWESILLIEAKILKIDGEIFSL